MSLLCLRMKTLSSFFYGYSFALFLFFAIFLNPTSVPASECQIEFHTTDSCSLENEDIVKRIKSYLSNNSLEPIFSCDKMNYEIHSIDENPHTNAIYVLGVLTGEEGSLLALFSIQKGWLSNKTELVYLTSDDILLSPLLFTDISLGAATFLPKSPSYYHVFITKVESSGSQQKFQNWIFFNKEEVVELLVILTDSKRGGVDFAIARWED